jgi:hypothetical protein
MIYIQMIHLGLTESLEQEGDNLLGIVKKSLIGSKNRQLNSSKDGIL